MPTREVAARMRSDWTADIVTYDRVAAQALVMADQLSEGIIRQFPHKF